MNEDICEMYNNLKHEHANLVDTVENLTYEIEQLKLRILELEMSL